MVSNVTAIDCEKDCVYCVHVLPDIECRLFRCFDLSTKNAAKAILSFSQCSTCLSQADNYASQQQIACYWTPLTLQNQLFSYITCLLQCVCVCVCLCECVCVSVTCTEPGCSFVEQTKAGLVNYTRQRHGMAWHECSGVTALSSLQRSVHETWTCCDACKILP